MNRVNKTPLDLAYKQLEVIVLVLLNSINEKLYKSTSLYKEGIFLTKYKFSGAFSEGALIKLKMISPIVLKGVVY